MQAIILCGGKGTRLSAMYPDRPKALVPICGRPFLQWQIEWLARNGIADIHLAAGHKAELIQQWLEKPEDRANSAFSFSLSVEPSPLGTGGGLKFVESFLRSDPFFVLNGDSLMPNLSFADVEQKHRGSRPLATIVVTEIRDAGRYGTVEFDVSGSITAFREKTRRSEGWINGGIYLMNRTLLNDIPAGQPFSLETQLFPALAEKRLIAAFPATPPLLDMGTPDGIADMERFLSAAKKRQPRSARRTRRGL